MSGNNSLGIRIKSVFDYKGNLDELKQAIKKLETTGINLKVKFDDTKISQLTDMVKKLKVGNNDFSNSLDFFRID